MIEINLLPEGRKKKISGFKKIDLSGFKLENTAIFGIIGVIVSILFVVQILLVVSGLFIKGGASSLEKRYKNIATEKSKADELRAQINLVNRKVRAIDELMVNRFSWAKKLQDLNNSMVPGVWLTELSYDERQGAQIAVQGKNESGKAIIQRNVTRYLTIAGFALNAADEGNATIGKFIKSLKNNKDFYSGFSDIQLAYTRVEKVLDQDVVDFKMTCFFKDNTK